MKNHTLMSLSIQKEIKKQRISAEPEVNRALNELNVKTLLCRSNIKKEKGYSPASLLFVMLLLPLAKMNLTSLWTMTFISDVSMPEKMPITDSSIILGLIEEGLSIW